MDISRLKFYSVGVVAVNKKLTSHFVEITPLEETPYLDGEITDNEDKYKAKSKDFSGGEWEVKLDTTASIRAKWLPMGNSNRITAPDVRRGEVVALYRFGDVDEFYWMTLLQDKHVRRLETVIYSFSNNREENINDDPTSTYYTEVSTHKKLIHIHTSKNDDEPFTYDIQINTKDGRIVITDDVDNYILLDSANTRIKIRNKDDSFVDLDKKIITIHAPEKINMITKHLDIKASKTIKVFTETYNTDSTDYKLDSKKTIDTNTKTQTAKNKTYDQKTEDNINVTTQRKPTDYISFNSYDIRNTVVTYKINSERGTTITGGIKSDSSEAGSYSGPHI